MVVARDGQGNGHANGNGNGHANGNGNGQGNGKGHASTTVMVVSRDDHGGVTPLSRDGYASAPTAPTAFDGYHRPRWPLTRDFDFYYL